jgi:glucose-6-phosphate-specific signal transduction histidine kinase
MAGAHRNAAGNAVIDTLKAAATLIAIVTAPLAFPAALAFAIYLLATRPVLEGTGIAWVLLALVLIAAIVRLRRDNSSLPWIAVSTLLMLSSQFISIFARQRNWPAGQLHVITLVNDWVYVPALACVAVGVVIGVRSGHLWWPRRPAA